MTAPGARPLVGPSSAGTEVRSSLTSFVATDDGIGGYPSTSGYAGSVRWSDPAVRRGDD